MNNQKHADISVERACAELVCSYPQEQDYFHTDYMEYYAFPYQFSDTGGPFKKPNCFYGQAFTTFTIEAWVANKFAVLFCNGQIVKTINNWDGIGSVRL